MRCVGEFGECLCFAQRAERLVHEDAGCDGIGAKVVTDNDDCSLDDPMITTSSSSCEHPDNAQFLRPLDRLETALREAKDNRPNSIRFATITGVPTNDACEGAGDEIAECLTAQEMEFSIESLF